MAVRGFGAAILVLSALVLAYVAGGYLADAPPLLVFSVPGALGAAALGLMLLAGKG